MRKNVQRCQFLFSENLSKKTFLIEPTSITRFHPVTKQLCASTEFFYKYSLSFIYSCSFSLKSKASLIIFCSIQLGSLPAGQAGESPGKTPDVQEVWWREPENGVTQTLPPHSVFCASMSSSNPCTFTSCITMGKLSNLPGPQL